MLDEANAYERGMDDDLTFQTVRELAGAAYMAGRSAPPTDAEVEAVAKRLCWNSCEWDGIESDYVAKDEDDAWDYWRVTAVRASKITLGLGLLLTPEHHSRPPHIPSSLVP